jgi:hypothetical protein
VALALQAPALAARAADHHHGRDTIYGPATSSGSSSSDGGGGCAGQLLYNNLCLPKEWPPRGPISKEPVPPGYLATPPATINIDIGRQLFVDDFLLDSWSSGTYG